MDETILWSLMAQTTKIRPVQENIHSKNTFTDMLMKSCKDLDTVLPLLTSKILGEKGKTMSMKTRMNEGSRREAAVAKMYKDDKNFRADKLIEAWSRIPEVGEGLKTMPVNIARNTAINLDRQYAFMSSLKEAQMSSALNNFTPENMLRLVRLAMPNLIRNKLFTEVALETTKDSIQYVRPFFSKTANGHDLNDRDSTYGLDEAGDDDYDPWNYGKGGEFASDNFRKALYEEVRDRHNMEIANVPVVNKNGEYNLYFRDLTDAADREGLGDLTASAIHLSTKWGKYGANYVDGSVVIMGYNEGDDSNKVDQQIIAVQDIRSGLFLSAPGFKVELTKPVAYRDKFRNNHEAGVTVMPNADGIAEKLTDGRGIMTVKIETTDNVAKAAPWYKEGTTTIRAYGRFNAESDLEGNHLGEVEIRMADYQFKPTMTSIGVSWNQLTEITLQTSYNTSAEELLVSYASQEIRSALDYRAIKLAYQYAKTNASHNPNYYYVFDAAYATEDVPDGSRGAKDGYRDNAATIVSAFDAIGDVIYDEILRGGVSKLCGGPSAVSYLKLAQSLWSPTGKQSSRGAHQEGTFDSMPVFKVPSSIIPTDEILTVWKDDQVETEVSIVFGTLVPFFSTGIIPRKNFYKEAGIATWGDHQVLNRRFLALVKIKNMKDFNQKENY